MMTTEPVLLFLHGVGDGDPGGKWRSRVTETLLDLGYPDLDAVRVIAPKFAHALTGFDEPADLPPVTVKQPSRDAARQNRRDFERRTGAIEFRLGLHDRGNGMGIDAAVNAAVGLPQFKQAHNYLAVPEIRAQVLARILSALPTSGHLVIVGHSLGSVIAADLVRRLPLGLDVAGMITIGSPLAHSGFGVDKLGDSLKEPPTNLAWWVNFWNAPDLVAAQRGVSSVFPWMVDFRINTKTLLPKQAHSAVEYLGDNSVAEAIGFALFGSRSKEVQTVPRGTDATLDSAEMLALLALRYAHLIMLQLDGDKQAKFVGALRSVQASVVQEIIDRNLAVGRATPSAITRLAFDMSDPSAPAPEPLLREYLDRQDAVVVLTILATENLIRPFEITVALDKRQFAMQKLTAEMHLGAQYGKDVFVAGKRAHEALREKGVNLLKLGAIGVGAAAIVVATGGLALAAGAGLAGAAVVTSALAAFGPGGMIGGLLTAGTLLTAGGGGIAFGLASSSTTAETLEMVVERLLASEILRQLQGLSSDPNVWRTLVETEIKVRREHERLDEFSDESAPAVKTLKLKTETVERALSHLRKHGLEPGVSIQSSEPR